MIAIDIKKIEKALNEGIVKVGKGQVNENNPYHSKDWYWFAYDIKDCKKVAVKYNDVEYEKALFDIQSKKFIISKKVVLGYVEHYRKKIEKSFSEQAQYEVCKLIEFAKVKYTGLKKQCNYLKKCKSDILKAVDLVPKVDLKFLCIDLTDDINKITNKDWLSWLIDGMMLDNIHLENLLNFINGNSIDVYETHSISYQIEKQRYGYILIERIEHQIQELKVERKQLLAKQLIENKKIGDGKNGYSFLELFKNDKEKIDLFFKILKSSKAFVLDEGNNWIYNGESAATSIKACFQVLADNEIIVPPTFKNNKINTDKFRKAVESEIKHSFNEKHFRSEYAQYDYLYFKDLFTQNKLLES